MSRDVAGDALNVCLNVVAVMFLTEVDEVLYTFGLSTEERSVVEAGAGKVSSTQLERRVLRLSKWAHVVLIMLSIMSPVLIGPPGGALS